MKINKIFEHIAKSKTGQKFYNWTASPGKDKFLNTTLPTIETVVSTGLYCWSTAKQKNIEKDQKDLLQWQNVLSGICGVVIGTIANKWIYKETEKIVKDLDPKLIDPKSMRKISTGLRIITPAIATGCIMRFILPTVTAGISGKIMDKQRQKRQDSNKKRLDVKF